VLSGEIRMALHLEFLFQHNHSDLLLLKQVRRCNGCRLVRLVALALAALQRYNSARILLGTTRAVNGML
jgi:hypothetical protein